VNKGFLDDIDVKKVLDSTRPAHAPEDQPCRAAEELDDSKHLDKESEAD